MAAKFDVIRVEIDLAGLNELMSSGAVAEVVGAAADEVAAMASAMSGEDYSSASRGGNFVAFGNAFPNSEAAAKDNYNNNTLEKALSSTGLPRSKGG